MRGEVSVVGGEKRGVNKTNACLLVANTPFATGFGGVI
jgi:hypothetical protein